MFTLTSLPRSGYLNVYATCERVTDESAAEGMPAEQGYVNSLDSRTIYVFRNNVQPVLTARIVDGALHDPDDAERLADLISELGAFHTSDGSTLYGEDVHVDYSTGDHFTYTLHAHVKHYDAARGYVEDDVNIVAD